MGFFSFFKKKEVAPSYKPIPIPTIEELKNKVHILFVDDKAVPKAKQLHDNDGWRFIQKISDVSSISQVEVVDAHIIFIDVQGVGKAMGFKDEGLGLIVALKEKYPEKKIVMYSAESQGQIDAFHHASDLVDGRLRKGADLYEFSTTTERLAQEAFCLDNCIKHIQSVFMRELNINKSDEEIKEIIQLIYNGDYYRDTNKMAELFNLSNIGSVASIIQLLFMPFA